MTYSVAHANLCAHNILRNGTEQQKQKYLPGLASADLIGGLGLTEPNAGSDAMLRLPICIPTWRRHV